MCAIMLPELIVVLIIKGGTLMLGEVPSCWESLKTSPIHTCIGPQFSNNIRLPVDYKCVQVD